MGAERELSDPERAVLELADSGLSGGAFWNATRRLGYDGVIAYWRHLNVLLGTERAEAAFPGLVHRLRRLRDQGARRRVGVWS